MKQDRHQVFTLCEADSSYSFVFPGRTEVISASPDGVRGSFSTPQQALKLLSAGGNAQLRLVSADDAQKQAAA
jgi:hypothetical protein